MLNSYLQLVMRVLVFGLLAYLMLSWFCYISSDLSAKLQTENDILLLEITKCTEEFYLNKCMPD